MDMRPINNITIDDANKAPLQETGRERIRGAKYFTRLDMRDGYHHLRTKEGSEHLTAFLTEYGLFEWTVVCFSLKNEFARFMTNSRFNTGIQLASSGQARRDSTVRMDRHTTRMLFAIQNAKQSTQF
jgi:hypothetical protein